MGGIYGSFQRGSITVGRISDTIYPDLSFIFGKMQVINNIPDFRVSYYCGRTIERV